MTECIEQLSFSPLGRKSVVSDFSGGDLSSDGGFLLLRDLDKKLGLVAMMSSCIEDPRAQEQVVHPQEELLRQRVFQICAGYEDVNDSNTLRKDAVLKTCCNRLPEDEQALASQPTITRLENRITKQEVSGLRKQFVEYFISSKTETPTHVTLDIDGFDDPTHGQQELSFYHGYYKQHMYYPVLINDAESGYPLVLHLRAGNSHPGKGVQGILRWLLWRLRRAWPGVMITVRGDGGFSLPELLTTCERAGVEYVFGYSRNAVLERKNEFFLDQARIQFFSTGNKARLFNDVHYQAGSWPHLRRVIMKAEYTAQGANQRFLVTNKTLSPQAVYDECYVKRGEDSENRIKELKRDVKADRLSCSSFRANQFRLFLHQAAFILMLHLRQAAKGTCFQNARIATLRLKIIKLAARVSQSVRRVYVQFSSACPLKHVFAHIAHNIAAL